MNNLEIDGRYWVGTDGKAVDVSVDDNGTLQLGDNASEDLRRYAALVSGSGSETALKGFQTVAGNETKVNFRVVEEETDNGLLGLHQAHDKDGNPLRWEAGASEEVGKFDGEIAYKTDSKGNTIYEEATNTIFEGNFTNYQVEAHGYRYGGDTKFSKNEVLVSVFTHEQFHDTDQGTINAIKTRQEGGVNRYKVETNAYDTNRAVLSEIKKKRK